MKKKRITIISGAGAVLGWKAKSTTQITDRLRNDFTFKTNTGDSIANYLYNKLSSVYHKDPEQVNFETILNSLEILHTFLFSRFKSSINKFKSSIPAFFDLKDEIFIDCLDFNRNYKRNSSSFYSEDTQFGIFYWNDYDEFILKVYEYYANLIGVCVKEYSRYENIEKHSDLNKSYLEYFNYYKDDFSIRYYTLNYDRLPVLATNFPFFEGFTNSILDADRVFSSLNEHCYYNLHGSMFYSFNGNQELRILDKPIDRINVGGLRRDLGGNSIPNYQIITGLNKASQVLIYPYNIYYSSLMYDLRNSDEVHFIGYSFNDLHINNIFHRSVKPKKVIIVDYLDYLKNYPEKLISLDNDGRIDNLVGGSMITQYEALKHYDFLSNIKVAFKGFESFLTNKEYS